MVETKHFGRIMREKRERSGITLRILADKVDMSENALHGIEYGDSDPKLSTVLKIAGALEIDMGALNSCVPIFI